MEGRSIIALFVSVVFLVGYIVLVVLIGGTPQEISGYDLQLYDLNEGESYAVAALSPSVKSANYEVSATSDDIFLFTGNSEIVALQTTDGFSHEGQATLGEWQIVEGSFVDLKIHSETALKVVVDRGIYYHMLSYFGLGILLLLLWAFAMYFTYNS
ncbi:MAG: hypothetical protein UW35_C0001G0008 [Candidatus Collierbacteria bacterium GW2011_GWF2_44_15]|uniref:Uncharacterized protein n=5 Tax=Candidatus Collieribacteriota TaxID=1752725 RepID=A0A0G1KH76_9BACT|nr:MAG: hypothetical protein UW23_C0003G0009 [Candidatus Collierbacteria bacterium GW2011_GWA1_44_12]KKT39448.1 MAG: hypothetical protein UW26_C0002G0038 [Candidatus Collierbacteria bacterium GW2011_GWF1_44_12]KKT47219.1 MAG: hypothetical protein UW35_C0001G0008 [Candidatus Collierbacteria bacterium GW2011_GWF2_44_15]KKT98992.1 MAG: hypothetical protein UW99_C0011G0007 [Candidatus Collierbacteria bacterium GW2011_GWC2_45_15]KKU30533.1 MAG: hypothetical protein UX41_C0001G0002 [Candidatus Collie